MAAVAACDVDEVWRDRGRQRAARRPLVGRRPGAPRAVVWRQFPVSLRAPDAASRYAAVSASSTSPVMSAAEPCPSLPGMTASSIRASAPGALFSNHAPPEREVSPPAVVPAGRYAAVFVREVRDQREPVSVLPLDRVQTDQPLGRERVGPVRKLSQRRLFLGMRSSDCLPEPG